MRGDYQRALARAGRGGEKSVQEHVALHALLGTMQVGDGRREGDRGDR